MWYPLVIQHSYWKWPFIVDFPLKMMILHSYVSLPEGTSNSKIFPISQIQSPPSWMASWTIPIWWCRCIRCFTTWPSPWFSLDAHQIRSYKFTILDQTSKNDPKPPRFRQTFHMQKHKSKSTQANCQYYCGGIWTLWVSHSGDSPWVAPNCSGYTHNISYYTHM